MKNAAELLLGATLLAATTAPSAAELLTVEVRARVTDVYDSSNVLAGALAVGQIVTGSYTYDVDAPDQDSSLNGWYQQPEGSVKLTSGPLVFESSPDVGMRYVEVQPAGAQGNNEGVFRVSSEYNKPLPNGATVWQIHFNFRDFTGQQPTSDALLTAAPNLRSFPYHTINVYGELNGQVYSAVMEIEYTYSAGVESELLISPGKSTFVWDQRFDVALLLPSGSDITSATSSIDGVPLPMSFPGSCHLAAPNSQDRPAIICPDAHLQLRGLEGNQRVDWAVELSSGRVIEHSVEWTLVR